MATLFNHPDFDNHQQVMFCNDPDSGLRAIIAIHDSTLGPSLGGCRMYPYANETDALTDVLRLSKGMTYKSAITGLPLGGGKSVIIGDSHCDKHRAMLHRMGEFVDSLGGRYIIAEDSGTSQDDMDVVRQATCFAAGVSGDPSPYTARGVYQGIKAAIKHRYGRDDLEGIKVAIQGVGNVGSNLAALLHRARAILYVSDVYDKNLLKVEGDYDATIVDPARIVDQEVDVFAPCAMGAVLDADTIKRLQASIVAGAANNQLSEASHGALLQQRRILYAPDYAINAGGVIAVWFEYSGRNIATLPAEVDRIYETLREIFEQAEIQRQPTSEVANQIALLRLTEGKTQDTLHRIAV